MRANNTKKELLLKRLPKNQIDLKTLQEGVTTLEDLLYNPDKCTAEILEKVLDFQEADGSFRLLSDDRIPTEARIDFIYIPTYLAVGIFMREYLGPSTSLSPPSIMGALERAISFSLGRNFRGHGYESESDILEALTIFERGGLKEFLENSQDICPEFHALVWNIIDNREALIEEQGAIAAGWAEDYTDQWKELITKIRPKQRRYLAYGSNMLKKQMTCRCPGAKRLGSGYLTDYALRIYRVATIEKSPGSKTPFIIWEIDQTDENKLNRYEGFPRCYLKENFVITLNKTEVSAMAYIMAGDNKKNQRQSSAKPEKGYLDSINKGYQEAGFTEKPGQS